MRIQWSSEAAYDIVRQMRSARYGLLSTHVNADFAREALKLANEDRSSDTLLALNERLESCLKKLEQTENDIAALIRSIEAADAQFNEIEEGIIDSINRIKQPPELPGARERGSDGENQMTGWRKWIIPHGLPRLRISLFGLTPTWLEDLLADPNIFDKL